MQIVQAIPAKQPKRKRVTFRHDYSDLFKALKHSDGAWLSISPLDVSGETTSRKQTILYLSARQRKMKVQTTAQDGMLYIRVLPEMEVSNA